MSKTTEFKEPNADGTVIVVLADEIHFKGEDLNRVKIPALRGKHLARLTFNLGTRPTHAALIEWCTYIVEPIGCVEEMSPRDTVAIADRAADLLGKSLETGDSPSE